MRQQMLFNRDREAAATVDEEPFDDIIDVDADADDQMSFSSDDETMPYALKLDPIQRARSVTVGSFKNMSAPSLDRQITVKTAANISHYFDQLSHRKQSKQQLSFNKYTTNSANSNSNNANKRRTSQRIQNKTNNNKDKGVSGV
jgi:hypothetical protein